MPRGAIVALAGRRRAADGVADAKALIEKYSKLPTFEPPGPAFDAKACMAGKKIFAIPLTNDNPFDVAIVEGMEQAAKMVGFDVPRHGRPSFRPTSGRRASTRRSRKATT